VKFYLPTLQSFTAAGYPRSPKSINKLSMNKSDRLTVYEVCFTLASSTQQYFSFIYFSAVFSVCRFLNEQKSLGGHTKNSVTLQ